MADVRQGMCCGCPWNYGNEATEMAYNLGCLPSVHEATTAAKDEGKAWACHSEPGKVCCGFAAQEKTDHRLELFTQEGTHVPVSGLATGGVFTGGALPVVGEVPNPAFLSIREAEHDLYTPADFTNEDHETSQLARLVIDGGLGICKRCGAGECELDDYPTCLQYRLRDSQSAASLGAGPVQLTIDLPPKGGNSNA